MVGYKQTYLIIRFSSLGNVAMLVPIVAGIAHERTDVLFLVLTQQRFSQMFSTIPNVKVIAADYSHKPETIKPIFFLFKQLKSQYNINYVCDMQGNVRSQLLSSLFSLNGTKTVRIKTPKRSYRNLLREGYSSVPTLPSQFDLYWQTLQKADLQPNNSFNALQVNQQAADTIFSTFGQKGCEHWLGIAPFAKSKTNMLPYSITKAIIAHFANKPHIRVFLFGAGKVECEMLGQWAKLNPNITSVAGTLTLGQELELIRQLDLMVGMDSANQHLASLVQTRCLSIWAGTHPNAGFYGWKQKPQDCIQQPLSCRPCTIHGKNTCFYHNFLCKQFSTNAIIQQIEDILID